MPAAPEDLDRQFLASLTVLCVEDEPTTRAVLLAFLRRSVRRVLEAKDGEDGLAKVESERPDVVLTDIQMPTMDGLTMAAELRKRGHALPVVVTTAFEEVGYLRRSIEVGVDRFVTKPVDVASLDAALLAVARRLRAEQALERERLQKLEELQTRHLESIGLMAGGMAHDFNNLLQSICGGIALAEDYAEPGTELRAILSEAMDSAQQASVLGRQLLALARERLFLRPAALAPIVEDSLRKALTGSAVQLDLQLGELPPVALDRAMLERVFAELARNACEAMPRGGALHVTAREQTLADGDVPTLGAGRYVVVALRDEGPGIAGDLLPKVFEPYVSTKERGTAKGMGLGLAVCRALVHKHHGHVTAESPPGGGARLQVYLPVAS